MRQTKENDRKNDIIKLSLQHVSKFSETWLQ